MQDSEYELYEFLHPFKQMYAWHLSYLTTKGNPNL